MGAVKVVVSGGTGVIGRAAVPALVQAGHEVVVVSRRPENLPVIERLGGVPAAADIFDVEDLVRVFSGADAVVNLATHVPNGYSAARGSAWRLNDALRTTGVGNVVDAARAAGVRRVVQESVSFVYADAGDAWVTEENPIEITTATEPAAVGESRVQDYACDSRVGVVLRLGTIIGDDAHTRFWLAAARNGRPVGIGAPENWAHVVHADDLGPAVLAALVAPSGTYNVGAEPITRRELANGYAIATGGDEGAFLGPLLRWLAGPRVEPLTRSLRISSEHFSAQTGWRPTRPKFDTTWFDTALAATGAAR